ncbi:MAG TPA: GFA family protein [Rhodanobacteraceae bacterium]|nr:GFA family protein [Rhodanobacteraceae bacterium]
MTEQTRIEGGCACGAIRYRSTAEPGGRTLCHCESCRRASGAPAVAWAIFPADTFAIVAGTPREHRSSEHVTRSFCGTCGTPLTYRSDRRPEVVDVHTATLDDPDAFAPKREIWTGEKLAWSVINPALPQFVRSSKG